MEEAPCDNKEIGRIAVENTFHKNDAVNDGDDATKKENTFTKHDKTAPKQSATAVTSSNTSRTTAAARKLKRAWPPSKPTEHQNIITTTRTTNSTQTTRRNSIRAWQPRSSNTTAVDGDRGTWKDRRQKRLQTKLLLDDSTFRREIKIVLAVLEGVAPSAVIIRGTSNQGSSSIQPTSKNGEEEDGVIDRRPPPTPKFVRNLIAVKSSLTTHQRVIEADQMETGGVAGGRDSTDIQADNVEHNDNTRSSDQNSTSNCDNLHYRFVRGAVDEEMIQLVNALKATSNKEEKQHSCGVAELQIIKTNLQTYLKARH